MFGIFGIYFLVPGNETETANRYLEVDLSHNAGYRGRGCCSKFLLNWISHKVAVKDKAITCDSIAMNIGTILELRIHLVEKQLLVTKT